MSQTLRPQPHQTFAMLWLLRQGWEHFLGDLLAHPQVSVPWAIHPEGAAPKPCSAPRCAFRTSWLAWMQWDPGCLHRAGVLWWRHDHFIVRATSSALLERCPLRIRPPTTLANEKALFLLSLSSWWNMRDFLCTQRCVMQFRVFYPTFLQMNHEINLM